MLPDAQVVHDGHLHGAPQEGDGVKQDGITVKTVTSSGFTSSGMQDEMSLGSTYKNHSDVKQDDATLLQ